MGWFKQLCLSWIILFAAAACASCQELRSTLREGNRACQGEEVIFTCTVRGSSSLSVLVLAWSSTEYIGQGGSLQLSTANMLGAVRTSTVDGSVTATATLTNNTIDNGELVVESTLRIIAIEASTVTCTGTSGGPASMIGFTISAAPGVPQRISAAEISRPLDDVCIILVSWDPPANSDPSDIDQYRVYVPSQNIRDDISSSTISTLTLSNCGVDVRVQVAAVNRDGCVGMNSSEVQLILLDIPSFSTKDESATTAGDRSTTEGGSAQTSSLLGAGAIAGIAIGGFALGAVSILLCYVLWRCVHQLKQGTVSTGGAQELAGISKTEDVDYVWDIQKKALMQAKECYQKQSKHDFDKLGAEKDQVSVPIWMDDKLDDIWKGRLREAVQAINEAAPGLSLLITDKNKAIIYILAIDEKDAYTEGNIQVRSTTGQKDYITKIHLGNWEHDKKKGISTRELFHALGFYRKNKLGLTRFDPLSITLYQDNEIYDSARKKYPGDPVWRLKKRPVEKNTTLSGLDKVGLNLVYHPCKIIIGDSTRCKYTPKLGKTGMYYCGRRVMSGETYTGDNYTDGFCGPNDGPNCPACRTIKNKKVEEILTKRKWQGMTGRVYCGRPFAEPDEISEHHDGICGINNGPACPDCNDLLNKEM